MHERECGSVHLGNLGDGGKGTRHVITNVPRRSPLEEFQQRGLLQDNAETRTGQLLRGIQSVPHVDLQVRLWVVPGCLPRL